MAATFRDVGLAEDFAQEALVAALEQWGDAGVPERPGAWLMRTAKHKAIDRIRRDRVLAEKYAEVGRQLERAPGATGPQAELERRDRIEDDVLRLIFTTCHPVLSREAQVALTLRMVGGLSTDEIARAFLVSKATLAQRVVRAKRTLSEAQVPFELPDRSQLVPRLDSVLGVIYLIFNEGYAATSGTDWARPALCEDGLRLGRMLAALAPAEPEVHGLVALMEIQASRLPARRGPKGRPVLLMDQDRSRWDRVLIGRGLAALGRAERLAAPLGPYALQAAIAACHARANRPEDTDWQRIVALYDALAEVSPSPVVELNRAVAVAEAFGPEEAITILDRLSMGSELSGYHLLPSVRAEMLRRLGRVEQARTELDQALDLTANQAERRLLEERIAALRGI